MEERFVSTFEWKTLIDRVREGRDILEDGAYVSTDAPTEGDVELHFYASSLNKPHGWRYSISESLANVGRSVAQIGFCRQLPSSNAIDFVVHIHAAAQSLTADYEGGAGDFDDATFLNEVDQAVRGTPTDREWIVAEFDRLISVTL